MTENSKTQNLHRFTAQTTMLEALTADPSLGMVLMRDFHLGGCSHCGFDPHDSIENVASQNGIPTERLLAALNRTA
ncbi:MAG: disulfide oxidoreductase [Planctomycetes bacterium]|nr:disulfide oxidoreductase [Planctomycetota bacterium]